MIPAITTHFQIFGQFRPGGFHPGGLMEAGRQGSACGRALCSPTDPTMTTTANMTRLSSDNDNDHSAVALDRGTNGNGISAFPNYVGFGYMIFS
jgi:hypothetical protein